VKQTGYSGLDAADPGRYAAGATLERRGAFSIDALLSYSAASCGTGLGYRTAARRRQRGAAFADHRDMASLAVKWHKPLSARLLPALGKRLGRND